MVDESGCSTRVVVNSCGDRFRSIYDWSLARHAEELTKVTGIKLKKSSVGSYLKRLGITHKKRVSSPPSEMS